MNTKVNLITGDPVPEKQAKAAQEPLPLPTLETFPIKTGKQCEVVTHERKIVAQDDDGRLMERMLPVTCESILLYYPPSAPYHGDTVRCFTGFHSMSRERYEVLYGPVPTRGG